MSEGPSHAPPPLPEGWIAQWDPQSGKYYFVELATRETRWEAPSAEGHVSKYDEGAPGGAGQQDGPDGERGLGVCILAPWGGGLF